MAESVHVNDAQLELLMAGALSGEQLAELEDHVDSCAACSELLIRVAQQVTPGDEPAEAGKRSIGRYQVSRKLGAGGMGVVYAAFDPNLRRDVALKLVKPDSGDAAADKQRSDRLLREAHALAALSHPNIVAVFDAGVVDDQLFIATELIKGRTVTEWVRDEAPGMDDIVDVYTQVAEALAAAHAAEIVHRDVKPDNILIGDDGRVRLVDFGLATEGPGKRSVRALASTIAAQRSADGELVFAEGSNEALTVTGAVMGTPLYMAPEQLLGPTSDPRADQFSFCVSLYESRYRKRPFAGKTMAALAENVMVGNVRDVELATPAASRLHAVILKGLSPEPGDRYESMTELGAALAAVVVDVEVSRRPLWPFVAAALAVVALVIAGIVVMQRGTSPGSGTATSGTIDAGVSSDGRRIKVAAGALRDARPSTAASPSADAMVARASTPDASPRVPAGAGRARPTPRPIAKRSMTTARKPSKPVTAARTNNTAAITEAMKHFGAASRMIARRNPGCRGALSRFRAARAKLTFDPGLVVARCQMVVGDCSRGMAAAAKFIEAKGAGAVAARSDAAREGRMFCSTSVGSWQQRLERLIIQAHIARTSRALARRYWADVRAVVSSGGAALTRANKVAVFTTTRTLADALSRFSECGSARAALRLGTDLYLGSGQPLWTGHVPPSASLKACLSAASP